jgi:hypothetical protein
MPDRRAGRALPLLLLLLVTCPAALAQVAESSGRGAGNIVTVGPDAACHFADLQSAIDFALDGDVIRVMSGGGYTGDTYLIDAEALTIRGGYPDCAASSSPSGRTLLDAGGSGQVMTVRYNAPSFGGFIEVNLENLQFSGGGGSGTAGGVLIEGTPGRLGVNLRNVQISGNTRTGTDANGAGLRILTLGDHNELDGPFVTVDNDSLIIGNTADGEGGGIYCNSIGDFTDDVIMLRVGGALISQNQASDGGGVAVRACKNIEILAGGASALFLPTGGIVDNEASNRGGGLFIQNGGEVLISARAVGELGLPEEAALLAGNSAGGTGGGADVGPNGRLVIEDTYVINNVAGSSGGAFNLFFADLVVRRQPGSGACRVPFSTGSGRISRPPCSVIDGNSAGTDGAVVAAEGASTISIGRSIIRNNTIDAGFFGSVVYAENDASYSGDPLVVDIESSLIHANTGNLTLYAGNAVEMNLAWSTAVDNPAATTLGLGRAFAAAGQTASLNVVGSIIGAPAALFDTFGDGNTQVSADCVIGDRDLAGTGFTVANAYSNIDPQFVDPGNDNYRIAATSPAIDYCGEGFAPTVPDLAGVSRGQVWTGPSPDPAPNPGSGDFDLGAYELLAEIFSDRFEG